MDEFEGGFDAEDLEEVGDDENGDDDDEIESGMRGGKKSPRSFAD